MNNILKISLCVLFFICVITAIFFIKQDILKKNAPLFPMYLSTKYDTTNVRSGPDTTYPVILIYIKLNMPLKVIDQHDNWYQIEDITGKKGWILKDLTTHKKTAIINTDKTNIYISPNMNSKVIAIITKNYLVEIEECLVKILLCKAKIYIPKKDTTIRGWIEKHALWGYTVTK